MVVECLSEHSFEKISAAFTFTKSQRDFIKSLVVELASAPDPVLDAEPFRIPAPEYIPPERVSFLIHHPRLYAQEYERRNNRPDLKLAL